MFQDILTDLEFAESYADEIFPLIRRGPANDYFDDTFITTLRILLSSRDLSPRQEKEPLCVLSTVCSYATKDTVDSNGVQGVVPNVIPANTIRFMWTPPQTSALTNDCIVSAIDREFTNTYDGWEELRDLKEFFAKYAQARFFINRTDRSVFIFVPLANLRLFHLVQFMTSRLLPWYFEDFPLTQEERKFVKSLTQSTPDEYLDFVQEYSRRFGLREKKIERLTKDLSQKLYAKRLEAAENQMENKREMLAVNIAEYKTIIEAMDELSAKIVGLKELSKSGDDNCGELQDYLASNKKVELIRAVGGVIDLEIKGTFENFDPEMYERLSRNNSSYIYDGYASHGMFVTKESRKQLLDAIFSEEPTLKIQTCGAFQLDMRGIVSAYSHYSFSRSCKDRIPNCHLDAYSCLGNQKPIIEEALRNGDYVAAIEQCVCSVESVNIGESATFVKLLYKLFYDCKKKCILLPDGKECTPTEALDWLRGDGYLTCPECGAIYKTEEERDACCREHN